MLYFGYMFLDVVDYHVEIVSCFIHAPCHGHLVLTCISIPPRASRTPLMSTHASYRLTGEQGGTRGAGASARTRAGRRPAGMPGPQA